MIIDMRTYTYHPDTYRPFLKYYREKGYLITSRYLGYNLGLFTVSSGIVNRTVQWFAYEDHDHRDACRKSYLSDSKKIAFTDKADKMIRQQESCVIVPTNFSPLQTVDPEHPILTDPSCERRIFEFNTYRCKPGQLGNALEIVEKELYPCAQRFSEWVIAYLTSDSGSDVIFELRAYRSLQSRMEINLSMKNDVSYREIAELLGNYLTDQNSEIWETQEMSPLH